MFGTKIRSWMEAHLARSRAKRNAGKEQRKAEAAAQHLQQHESIFDPGFFSGRADLNEILPSLAISSFKPELQRQRDGPRPHHPQQQQQQHPLKSNQPVATRQHPHHHNQQPRYENGNNNNNNSSSNNSNNSNNGKVAGSAVNLSSPESAYSTGYSTDGTSPCATYAPEYYINVRQQQQQQQQTQLHPVGRLQQSAQTRCRPAKRVVEEQRAQQGPRAALPKEPSAAGRDCDRQIDNTGTYTVSRGRGYLLDADPHQHQQQQHPWRKPAPPTSSRPTEGSPKLHSPGHQLTRKPYSSAYVGGECAPAGGSPVPPHTSYPLQLFSPRRMPLVATTTTQVMPVKSPRQRSRLRTNPWQGGSRNGAAAAAAMLAGPRAWSRQTYDYCCRQESLSVGRSPVNRSDWRTGSGQSRHPQQQQQQQTRSRARSSSASSCSSRSRSCSVSSSSNSPSNASSCSSDDITLNEVMGKYEDSYGYDKETDIVSEQSGAENNSSSLNFSSDASASSLELLQLECSSRSTTSRRQLRGLGAGRRHRRRRHRRSLGSRDDEDTEHREEVELLQEVLSRRLKKNKSEVSAQTNRALLERLLMKNASSGFESSGRRAWSANPPQLLRPAASRSVGGTPICLRRRTTPRHMLSPPSRLGFERRHQIYPAESSSSLKNMSASELALIEADKEADLKYAQLIMEAERMLLSAKEELEREESVTSSRRGSSASVAADSSCSPTRYSRPRPPYPQPQPQQTCTGSAPNKRVELIKNAELNIELALSKSRNSQPELSSGSIKDLLDHSSPKRLLQQQKKVIEPIVNQQVSQVIRPEYNITDFKSLDVNPAAMLRNTGVQSGADELSSTSEHYVCPQSEPVKRKVYEPHPESGRLLQRQPAPWLRNSDTDCASDQLQPQLQSASAASSYSQLRKHMLIETLQGLKQSLEDQSAALKMSCLRPL